MYGLYRYGMAYIIMADEPVTDVPPILEYLCIVMCLDMCVDLCTDLCIDICFDMCIDVSMTDMCTDVAVIPDAPASYS